MIVFNFDLYTYFLDVQEDSTEDNTEDSSNRLSESVSTEVTTEALDPDSIVLVPYDYQYSDIEFLAPFNEDTSEYEPIVIDNRPYLSSEVSGASIDDLYTMVLSTRNVLVLWFLIWSLLKFKTMIHNAVIKYMEGRS